MKFKSIISVSGHISSGKTYAANLISTEFGIPIASFGGYLKYFSEQNNLATDRKSLQDLGEEFIKKNPRQFLINVISHYIGSNDKIILEGVRHNSIFNKINQLTQNHLSVFIDTDLQTRYKRYFIRNKISDTLKTFDQYVLMDSHPVELEIESLKAQCEIVIDATKNYSSELFAFISSKLSS